MTTIAVGDANLRSVLTGALHPFSALRKTLSSSCDSFSIPELIAASAAHAPDAPAVVSQTQTLTYRDLESQSNRLAGRLLAMGAKRERIVGLCLERSPALAVGALGVLKAGAAYLPLDPSNPPERTSSILKDAQAQIVITSSNLIPSLPQAGCEIVDLADNRHINARYLPETPPHKVRPQQLAYVIYTSGSTGRPKGVEITHSNLLNLIRWHLATFQVSRLDRSSLLASPGFDASVWELWPYLCAGASLHTPDDVTRVSPIALRNWLITERITVSFVPTPLAEKLIALQWPADTALRFLLTGADVLHRYPRASLPFNLVNNYGPTECTVVATSGIVPSEGPAGTLPSIGKAIANMETHILDKHLQPVPVGSPGELHIGGAGVGRGYFRDPGLTARRFIPNLFSEDSRARLYKTGDLVRALPDGRLEFLGRMDEQVKIRGYRVEPNEISVALCSHPDIDSGVVVAYKNDRVNHHVLIAYLVPKKDSRPKASGLRAHIKARLPEYMVPGKFVVLDSLPLTPNGKVDRSALPTPTFCKLLRDTDPPLPKG